MSFGNAGRPICFGNPGRFGLLCAFGDDGSTTLGLKQTVSRRRHTGAISASGE